MKRIFVTAAALWAAGIGLAGFAPAAAAKDQPEWLKWPMGDRFTITGGAFFANLDTKVRVDSTNGLIGTSLDFEQNLGMSETESLPTLAFHWRFARRHKLSLSYFELRRSGSEVTETTIRIGDIVFQANLPVASFFDVDVLSLAYQYSVIFTPRSELALFAGLSVQDMSFGLVGNQGGTRISEQSDITAPLPTFGISGGYAFTDRWMFRGTVGYFALELDWDDEDNFEGSILDLSAIVYHQTFKYVRFGFGYSLFDVDVNWTKSDKFTSVDYTYHGPHIFIGATF